MHCEIDVLAEQRVLNLFHEEALASDSRERRVLQAVAGRLDDDDPARWAARSRDAGGDGVRLPQRQRTAARSQPERAGHVSAIHGDDG